MRKQSDSDVFNCIICKEDRHYFSIGACEHSKVCFFCCLRSRILYKDKKCPICTSKLDEIFIFEINEFPSSNSEIQKNKEDYYKDDEFEENGIYYGTISAQEEALKLKSFICPIKSCQDGAFDNLQTLCTHLNKVHKKYYCETCLKEGKRFLSEMPIYNYDSLNEHVTFGEYSEKGSLIVPPHPACAFCNIKFYNDEHLFKHMNEQHFICQLCRDKKNIVFYKELDQLLEHYKFMHYVCPYQECLDDMFVVFDSEEKLNSHLITRHKCQDAKNKITNFLFDKSKKQSTNYKSGHNKNEFNFSAYVNELKDRVKEYQDNLKFQKTYVKPTEIQNEYYSEANYYGKEHYGRGKKGKAGRYNEYSNQKHQQTPMKKPVTTDDFFNNAIEYIQVPENVSYNNQNYYQDDYYSHQARSRGDNRNKKNLYGQGKHKGHNKFSKEEEEKTNNLLKISENSTKAIGKTDYAFIFNTFAKMIKEYIIQKVQNENPKEEEFIVPRETIYQLIIIIDKLDNEKLFELTSLTNFGIDLDIHKELKVVISEGLVNQQKIWSILDKMELKKLLILYKYVVTAAKKIDGLFYKLELEQIDPDMYDDFGVRDKRYKKQTFTASTKENVPSIKQNKPKQADYKTKKLKFNDEEQFPTLSKGFESSENIRRGQSKLSSIFSNPTPKTTNIEVSNTKSTSEIKTEVAKYPKQQSKLAMALEGKIVPKPEPKKSDWGDKKLNKNKINYDEEFPEL